MSISSSSTDEELAETLRQENCDQFHILVRMHLSFVLDLNTDESDTFTEKGRIRKWVITPFSSKKKCRGIMDGAPLSQEGICQVYQLIKFLKQEPNICVEGIFRRTGSLNRQQELRGLLNDGSTLNLESGIYSVHDCASILKGFLAELPEPLLTEAHYPVYCQIAELYGSGKKFRQESRLIESLQLLLLLLPVENRALLKEVLNLLHLTASYESRNKMSADSLATLYTPHLLCPRKLAPEVLHMNSQTLSGILSYMIKKSSELFLIPTKLAVDIRAYHAERQRRKLSPQKYFDESVSDNFAAHTVFSFVDHERTAKENEANPTETALAQLYAYIQSLPESSKKQKLVKQFNKENGHGVPLQEIKSSMPKNKSFGESIKKHIFQKGLVRRVKKAGFSQRRSSSEELLNETMMTPRSRKPVLVVSGTNINNLPKLSNQTVLMDSLIEEKSDLIVETVDISDMPSTPYLRRSKSESDLLCNEVVDCTETEAGPNDFLTSTFREYLWSRSVMTTSPVDLSFSSRTDDYSSNDIKELSDSKMSASILHYLNGNQSDFSEKCDVQNYSDEKKLVLKPKQFDENGHPIVFETSF